MSSTAKVLLPTIKLPVTIEQAVSPKTGNPYNRFTIDFGDYNYTGFMRDEQVLLAQMQLEKAGIVEPDKKKKLLDED